MLKRVSVYFEGPFKLSIKKQRRLLNTFLNFKLVAHCFGTFLGNKLNFKTRVSKEKYNKKKWNKTYFVCLLCIS